MRHPASRDAVPIVSPDHRVAELISTDQELEATLERIRRLQQQWAHLRKVETNPVNDRLSTSGFPAEVDRMQLEVRDYLSLRATPTNAVA